jgi:hypothetical protein
MDFTPDKKKEKKLTSYQPGHFGAEGDHKEAKVVVKAPRAKKSTVIVKPPV